MKCSQVGLEGVMQLLMTFKIPSSMCGTQMNLSQASSNSLLSQSSEDIRRGKAISQVSIDNFHSLCIIITCIL